MDHPFAISLEVGTSLSNRTGSWRTPRPDYVHRLPPCNDACPAGEDIQAKRKTRVTSAAAKIN